MIEVTNFTKVYRLTKKQMKEQKVKDQQKIAVNNISFTANKGEIFGLLGPNGAGKTTTLRTIATLLKPTMGEINVEGYDVVKDAKSVRSSIGFLTNELKMETHFTPDYTMKFFGQLHGLDLETIKSRTNELFDYFGITEFRNKKIGELSTGMTQKLAIAVSLVHDPAVVIFDEPTNGLDIITAKAVTEYLQGLKNKGKLVIISTHIMTVAEKLCDRVAVIINGKKVADGDIASITEMTSTTNLEDAFFALYKENVKEVL
ncbi:Na+ ABC efflux transporter (ATP-binding protein) [Petrocella atlantisensis]|uniref:Na+ ABC efflux transporter (ATP-binding protein) n=1 Tax=Petrocella atlantisensis TaxID=2173034 RepID=A0A3P7NX26_9FIRM|nr:ATP-binding cassette domain-containing protein [Petrocella atlantisensis]VDN47535.1 Na+ ABC efflux transporter (ATP-binding protein) [Petrocella atlantisensis]